jgi:AcrR family transcriptional regulator
MMTKQKFQVSEAVPPPLRGVKASTFKLLLDTAMQLISDGKIPSVAEVASRSVVSRATAYRYFPTRGALITAVIEASLGPVRTLSSSESDGRERVLDLFKKTFPRFSEFEPQLRAAAQLALEQGALQRAGLLNEAPYRRGHRIRILEDALEPMKNQLPADTRMRLHHALSIVYGIEPYIILKDIWGLSNQDVENTTLWMVEALIQHALSGAQHSQEARPLSLARQATSKTLLGQTRGPRNSKTQHATRTG